MKHTFATLSMAALAAAVEINNLKSEFDPVEGQPWTIKYSGCPEEKGCTIWLRTGTADDSKNYKMLTDHAVGTSTDVTLSDIPSGDYILYIETNSTPKEDNFSISFPYKGSVSSSTTAKPTSTEAPTSTKESSTAEKTSTTSTSDKKKSTTTTSMTKASSTTTSDATTTTEESSSTSDAGASQTTTIPGDDGAGALGVPTTLVLAAAAGLFFLN